MSQSHLKGFTLVEILAIITIVGSLSVVITPRLPLFHSSLNESKTTLINSLTIARQIAMFSSEQNDQVRFILQNNTIRIRKGDVDIKHSGVSYSDHLGQGIKHTPETLVLHFNTLGETQKTKITLSANTHSESVEVHSTGYIQQ